MIEAREVASAMCMTSSLPIPNLGSKNARLVQQSDRRLSPADPT
ncbi:hypothetical protein JCM19240_6219 [Vibrio maritimus]|uniref:Uncharacterized protein n=1 Tax=Vibrio maritimus TaxID=990268 RepID=A0A090TNI6_9VIBR|nr:hypothetical protein JCM19240_6219 [Vibrio maritimus]